MILVAGSTGFLGNEISRRLVGRGHSVRALVRPGSDPAAVRALEAAGIELAPGDLKEPATIAAACENVHTVISTANAVRSRQPGDAIETVDGRGQLDLVDVAARAGVQHFILVSISGGLGEGDPLSAAKRAAERRLQQSGMRYTILRPTMFMEVWLGPALGFDYINRTATLYGTGDARISYISTVDVAEYAVRSVTQPAALDRIFELGGPAALSPRDAVRIFELAAGQPFTVQEVPEHALRGQLEAATDSLARTFAALALASARGDEIPPDPARSTFGMNLRSVQQYAAGVLAGLRRVS